MSLRNSIACDLSLCPTRYLCAEKTHIERVEKASIYRFRPCALGLLGLTVLVFIWATGTKLTRYHPSHGTPESSFIGKMWPESRIVAIVPIASRLRSHSNSISPDSSQIVARNTPHFHSPEVPAIPHQVGSFASFAYLRPFRSPPTL